MCVLVWPYTRSPAAAAAKYLPRKQEREAVKHSRSRMRNTNALSGITLCTLKHTTEQVRASFCLIRDFTLSEHTRGLFHSLLESQEGFPLLLHSRGLGKLWLYTHSAH